MLRKIYMDFWMEKCQESTDYTRPYNYVTEEAVLKLQGSEDGPLKARLIYRAFY